MKERPMMFRVSLVLLSALIGGFIHAQQPDTANIKRISVNTFDELRAQQELAQIDTLTYIDSTCNFKVQIPSWLHLQETGNVHVWGGTLPAVDGIENAIMIKSFAKSEFRSMEAFRKYVAEDLVFGKPAPWSDTHISMGKKELGPYRDLGQAYKAYFMFGNLLYHCQYVLAETPTAYIWIDYTSTQETFDKNLGKFEEFLNGVSTTDFR